MAKKKTTGKKRLWMQDVKAKMEKKGTTGALRRQAAREGALQDGISKSWLEEKAKQGGTTGKRARLALTFRKYAGKRKKRKKS